MRGTAHAEDVALFVVGPRAATNETAPILSAVERRLHERGNGIATADTVPAAAPPKKADVVRIGQLGKDALGALKSAAANETGLSLKYEPLIERELALTSSTQAADARTLLWNLCVLRVQLMIRDARPATDVEGAVHACRRMFVDQYEFSHVWQPEVIQAFKQHSQSIKWMPLDVQSSPAGCQVLLFGKPMGVTPLRLEVQEGEQEVQLQCESGTSRVHRISVSTSRELVVRLDGDAAISGSTNKAVVLSYAAASNPQHILDHVAALAAEAGARSFVVIGATDGGWSLQWANVDDSGVRSAKVAAHSSSAEIENALASLFAAAPVAAAQPRAKLEKTSRKPSWKDRALGSALVVGGAGVGAFSIVSMLDDGCAGSDCSRKKTVIDVQPWALVGGAGALLAAGVTVLVVQPFSRREHARTSISLGPSSIHVKGSF